MYETKDLPENIRCPFCKSKLISATFWSDIELKNIIERKLRGSSLSKDEENKFDRAWKIASLINNFGKFSYICFIWSWNWCRYLRKNFKKLC